MTRQELEGLFQCVVAKSNECTFLSLKLIRAALLGIIHHTKLSGSLAEYIPNLVLILMNSSGKCHSMSLCIFPRRFLISQFECLSTAHGQLSEENMILLNMLTTYDIAFDSSEESEMNLRVQLQHVLVLLAEISFAHGSRDFIKSFVVFLLEHVLVIANGTKKYKDLLNLIGVCPLSDRGEPIDDKFLARKFIIQDIVGGVSMDSVVDCNHAKNSLAKPWMPLSSHWAQDNYVPQAKLDEIVSALTPVSAEGDTDDASKVVATSSKGATTLTSSSTHGNTASDKNCHDYDGDSVSSLQESLAYNRPWYSGFASLFLGSTTAVDEDPRPADSKLAAEASKELETMLMSMEASGSVYAENVRQILGKLKKTIPAEQIVPTSTTTKTETRGSHTHPNTFANGGYGDATNGLTITFRGITACLINIFRHGNPEYITDEIRREIAMIWGCSSLYEMHSRIAQNLIFAPSPQTDIECALSGLYWTIEDVEFIKYLGGGGFGSVYLSRLKRQPSIQFAVKLQCLNAYSLDSLFAIELVEGSKLKHRNIVRTLGFFPVPSIRKETLLENRRGLIQKDPICMALMLEPCQKSLFDELPAIRRLKPLERLKRACDIMADVLAALVELEEASVFHRDVKPENILLGMDSFWKLADFGLARKAENDGTWSLSVGTAGYIPPEGPSPRHDIFSAGMVFLEMLTGSRACNIVPRRSIVRFFAEADMDRWLNAHQFRAAVDVIAGMVRRYHTERLTAKSALTKVKELVGLLPTAF